MRWQTLSLQLWTQIHLVREPPFPPPAGPCIFFHHHLHLSRRGRTYGKVTIPPFCSLMASLRPPRFHRPPTTTPRESGEKERRTRAAALSLSKRAASRPEDRERERGKDPPLVTFELVRSKGETTLLKSRTACSGPTDESEVQYTTRTHYPV